MGIELSLGFDKLSDEEKDIVRKKAWQPSALDIIPGVGLVRMMVKPYVNHGTVVEDYRAATIFYQFLALTDAALYLLT